MIGGFLSPAGKGQSQKDSLEKVIQSSTGIKKIDNILLLATELYKNNPVQSKSWSVIALDQSDKEDYAEGKAGASLLLAVLDSAEGDKYFETGSKMTLALKNPRLLRKLVKAINIRYSHTAGNMVFVLLHEVLKESEDLKDHLLTAVTYRALAGQHFQRAAYHAAILEFRRALDEYILIDKKSEIAGMSMNLGVVYYKTGELDSSLYFYDYARKAFISLKESKNEANAITNIALTYCAKGMLSDAIKLMKQAIGLYLEAGDSVLLAGAYESLGLEYGDHGNAKQSLEYLLKSTKIRELKKDSAGLVNSFINLGGAYWKLNSYDRAALYSWRGVNLAKRLGNLEDLSFGYNHLCLFYENRKMYDSALYYGKMALEIRKEIDARILIANSYCDLFHLYMEMNDLKNARTSILSAIDISEKNTNFEKLPNFYLNYASLCLREKNYTEALKYLLEGNRLIEKNTAVDEKSRLYEFFSECYYGMGRLPEAYHYLKLWKDVFDSLNTVQQEENITELLEKYESDKKEKAIGLLVKDQEMKSIVLEKQKEAISSQRKINLAIALILVGISVFAVFLFRSNREKKRANGIIVAQQVETEHQKNIIEEKNQSIMDSIQYAKRIQQTLLRNQASIRESFPESFIIFQPKDIVSGDFYWAGRKGKKTYLAVCDSTGHGVPGAFMSLLNMSFLNEAINEEGAAYPDEILNFVRRKLISSISQEGGQDGMDGVLIRFDAEEGTLFYAAAYNAPLQIRNKQVMDLPADKMPIGKGVKEEAFRRNEIQCCKGDMIYLFTDGFADQFGGEKGKKFKYRQLESLAVRLSSLSIEDQKQGFETAFREWKGNYEQVDDVCLVGIRM